MNDLKRNKHFPENIAANLKFLNNLQPKWKRHVTIVHQTKNLHKADFTQIYDFLKMNRDEFGQYAGQVAHNQQGYNAWQNGGIQVAQNAVQNLGAQNGGNQNGLVVVPGIANQNGTARPRIRDTAYLQTQLLIAQKEEAWIQLQAEEFDFVAAAGDLDEIEEINANCILMANLPHASTSGTQLDKASIYDTNGSAEVQLNDNCYDNKIFNMFTQEEQYTDLLEPIHEPQLVPHNDNDVTFVAASMVQSGGTVETSSDPNEKTRAHQETAYRNLIDQVAQEKEYHVLWNNWYTKCKECKYDKISYNKAYNDMQQKVKQLQAQLRDLKGLVHTARTIRPQPKGNTRNARFPSASKSSEVKKNVTVEDHCRILLLSKNKNTMSSECNNIKLAIRNDKSEIACGTNKKTVSNFNCVSWQVVQIFLWCVDSGCFKHMTGNIKLLINFVWKFLGTVRFGNVHIAAILGYGDLKWGNIRITRVYFVEGLGHNLFSVGQFCDADLKVAFRRNTCFIRDLDDLKELTEYNRSIFSDNNENHYVQNKEYSENPSNEIATSSSNQEKEEPPQDSDIRQLIREECSVEVCEEQKQNIEDTILELVEICRQKELLCMHDNVDDLVESALNSKLISINSQCPDKKEHEVKNIVEQPAERGNRTIESLQNFRVIHKNSISLKNTSQISSVHAVAPILSTKELEYSPSMGYEHPNTTPETKSYEITKSGVEELVPILSENEVTLEDKRECDLPVCENAPICDDHSDILSDSNNDDDISSDDDDFE
nr:integrase, catalytic region, zinc finger, CCHC-type, peptidase aspartic, catalytic [Tanacetum cinerariifolium]